jgi:NADH dehydrogenase
MEKLHHVVIVGGGFGGLYAATALRKAPVRVTLLDRRNFHLFQPLLYQVATGSLSPANIAAPLRSVLRRQRNARVLLAEVSGFDLAGRRVLLSGGDAIRYDSLIVAAGARHHYFGHPEWEKYAPGLKTLEDATAMRRRILLAFEQAERAPDPDARRGLLTFVVVGGGPTGVELAGAVGDLARATLRFDFRDINPATARVLLLEAADRILTTYPPKLSARAARSLEKLGVAVRTGTVVTDVRPGSVTVKTGSQVEEIRAHTVLWGAGVEASPLAKMLADATGAALDRAGRIVVQPDLSLPGRPEVFVLGDMANYPHQTGQPLPGVAPVAMQQGSYVAELIERRLAGAGARSEEQRRPFRYRDRGSMATIGPSAAVADLGWVRFGGFLAWAAWLLIHLIYLIQFQNRVLVLFQWAWNYFTRGRSARLITGENLDRPIDA